jgi:hypothetical protein
VIVRDGHGRDRRLVALGRAGGEGAIFRVADDEGLAAKIYHTTLSLELCQKLLAMCKAAPVDPAGTGAGHGSIAWPRDPLYSSSGRIIGFTMPLVDVHQFRQAHVFYDPEDRTGAFGSSFTWRHLMTAAQNLSSTVAAVHMRGHRVGDLRETNLLVAPTGLVVLIDCDSFQIRDGDNGRVYHCRVGSGEYLPPELQTGVDFGRFEVDRLEADRFSLAVLVFRFLMNGTHPFQGKGALLVDCPTIERKIRRGFFPYVAGSPVAPPEFAPRYGVVPASLRQLFERCFVLGLRDHRQRPTSLEWYQALHTEAGRLRRCGRSQHHWFSGDLIECPWCEEARRGRRESFPTARPPAFVPRTSAARAPGATAAGRTAPRGAVRTTRPLPNPSSRAVRRPAPAPRRRGAGAATSILLVIALVAAVMALGGVAYRSWAPPPVAGAGPSYGAASGPASAGGAAGGETSALNGDQASSQQVAAPVSTPLPAGAFDRLSFPALSPDGSPSPGSSLKGGAAVRACSRCSAGNAVDIGTGSLTLRVVVPIDGDYSIGVYYVAVAAVTIGVSVNGGLAQQLALEPSYDVQNPNRGSYVTSHLHAGANAVQLGAAAATVPSPAAPAPSPAASGPGAPAPGPSAAAPGPFVDKITAQLAKA